MESGHVDASLQQFAHDAVDLTFGQHKIAHHECAVGNGLKTEPTPERQSRPDGHSIKRHLQVAAWDGIAMNVALDRCGLAKRRIDFGPVDVSRAGRGGRAGGA